VPTLTTQIGRIGFDNFARIFTVLSPVLLAILTRFVYFFSVRFYTRPQFSFGNSYNEPVGSVKYGHLQETTEMAIMLSKDRKTFKLLQHNSLTLMLFLLVGLVAITVLISNIYFRPVPQPLLRIAVTIEAICLITYWLHHKSLPLAAVFMIGSLGAGNLVIAAYFDQPSNLYFFAALVLITTDLFGFYAACGVTAIGTTAILASSFAIGSMIGPLLLIWLILLISATTFRQLQQALEIAWGYQSYVVEQLEKSRSQRAELAHLTQALRQSEHSLAYTNTQLRHAYHVAEEARRMKAQFAANVSHELRTPINLIVGFSEIIALAPEVYGESLPPRYLPDFHAIYRNARHLQSLINDILDISQVEVGKLSIVKELIDPIDVLTETTRMARDLVERKGLSFEVNLPHELPKLWLDRTRIRQVVLNLIANAVRFTDQGSITLQAAENNHEWVRISVRDTGIGIQPDDLTRVFEQFFHYDPPGEKTEHGAGLGLTLSQQLIELHGGTISVESAGIPGQGSTFTLKLPTPVQPSDPFKVRPIEWKTNGELNYVLVYDSDEAVTHFFERYINQVKVVRCHAESDLAHLVTEHKPDALLIDSSSPQRAEVISKVHALQPAALIVECSMPSGRRLVQAYGVADYLVKPVTRDMLLRALESLDTTVNDILIVDDNRDIVRMFRRMLETSPQPYRLYQALSGQEGLNLMHTQHFDVVILDLVMPHIDGFTVIQHMKSDPHLKNIPIILVSARGASEAIEANKSHEKLVITKPGGFQPLELASGLDLLLRSFISPIVPAD
jgi:signal transduction histidine kinase/CheY-like chemotaxis protein